LLMVLAAVLAFATNLMVLRSHDQTRAVVVTSSDLVAGRPVERSDFRSVEVDVDDDLFTRLVPWTDVDGLAGLVAARAIPSGDLVRPTDLRPAAAARGLRAMSIPIEPEHAVGGDLLAGDRVDLILVDDEGTAFVLVDAEVLSVSSGDRGALSVGAFYVVVGVEADLALDVAAAIQDGRIELVRSTGAEPLVTPP
jgi:Flp pilus assembly protein CpaB